MPDLQRGVVAAGSWFAITYGAAVVLGLPISVSAAATSAAYLGASAVASDVVHNWWNVYPSAWSSALGTGLLFAASQRLGEGSSDYVTNVVSGAAGDVAGNAVNSAFFRGAYSDGGDAGGYDAATVTNEEGAVSTA
jgi:hypothetical protein